MRDVVREPALATYSQRSWRPRDAKKPCASERTGGKLLLLKRRESTSSAAMTKQHAKRTMTECPKHVTLLHVRSSFHSFFKNLFGG